MDVFLLWHIYELTDGNETRDEEKFIGAFSSEEKAKNAIEQLKGKAGFRDHPISCFEIHKSKIDRVGWVDGFVTVYHDIRTVRKMVKEYEIQGRVCNLPEEMTEEEFWHKMISFIEENGWSFGGGLERCKISGCISEISPDMTKDQFEEIFLGFVEHNGWSFEGSITIYGQEPAESDGSELGIQKYSFADMLNDLEIGHEIEFQYNGIQYAITNNMEGKWCFFADGKDYPLCQFEERDTLLNKVKNLSIQGKSIVYIIDQQLYDPDTLSIF